MAPGPTGSVVDSWSVMDMSVMQVMSLRVSRGSEQEAGGAVVLLPEPALTPSPEGRPILDEDSLLVWILILFICLFVWPAHVCGFRNLCSPTRSNPCLLQWKSGVVTIGPPGNSLCFYLKHFKIKTLLAFLFCFVFGKNPFISYSQFLNLMALHFALNHGCGGDELMASTIFG